MSFTNLPTINTIANSSVEQSPIYVSQNLLPTLQNLQNVDQIFMLPEVSSPIQQPNDFPVQQMLPQVSSPVQQTNDFPVQQMLPEISLPVQQTNDFPVQQMLPQVSPPTQEVTEKEIFSPKHIFTPLSSQFIDAVLSPFTSAPSNEVIKLTWLTIADEAVIDTISPWTFESTKKSINLPSLGEVRSTLLIRVVMRNQMEYQYVHQFSEEFMVGILSVLHRSNIFSFYLEDVVEKKLINPLPISLEDVFNNYKQNEIQRRYSVELLQGPVTFNTPDLIQGVITGAKWLNQDVNNFIRNLREGTTPLTF